MGLRLYGNARAFGDALAGSTGCVYSICNPDRLQAAQLLGLERGAAERGHRDLLDLEALQAPALAEIESYFREAARADPRWRFAYSSKVVLAVPEWQDLQKIFLLRRLFERDPGSEVLLLVRERRLRRLFEALFEGRRSARGPALPSAHAWGRFARTWLRTFLLRAPDTRPRVVVFTLSTGAPRAGVDAYFGQLAAAIGQRAPTLTVYLASGRAVRLARDAVTAPFEAFVSPLAVVAAWFSALVSAPSAVSTRGLERTALAPLHAYMRRTEVANGEYFMQRLLARGFGAMLNRLSPETLLYPFENRSWEKHLLAEAKKRGIARRVAYQHSSITPRHLAFHVDADEIAPEYLPERIVTIGERTAEVIRRLAPPLAARLATGASMRTPRQTIAPAPGPGVLVAISSSRHEALSLLRATHIAGGLVGLPFIVRTHPTIPIGALAALFDWPPNVELSMGRSLADDLSRVTMVAYSSSTVALEGMLYGRLPIFVDIGDLPSGDPIPGSHAFKAAARGGAGLAGEVERIVRLDSAESSRRREAARAYAESYLRAPTPEAVRDMAAVMLEP